MPLNNDKKYTSVELFAGAGGLALGLEKAGFHHELLVEHDKHATATLRQNRPYWHVIEEDVEAVMAQGIQTYLANDQPIDLLSGGYPCQAFSYAGKKLGLNDTRGTLFYSFAQALSQLKPKVFLAENVRGLLSHDGGKTLETMLDVFKSEGYTVQYKVLNAVDFSTAQKRERLVMVGVRNDLTAQATYHFPEPHLRKLTLKDILENVPLSDYPPYSAKKAAVLALVPPGGCWKNLPTEIAQEYMGKSFYSGGGRTGMARRLAWHEPALTVLCSPAQLQTERCHPDEVRPFTPRENARIQGFPDDWLFAGSLSQQYKQIGNAVPVPLAQAIGQSLYQFLHEVG